MKRKIIYIMVLVIALACILGWYFASKFEPAEDIAWGLTFSPRHAEYLGFDWQTMYLDILNDLQPEKLRLMTYWEDVEKQPEQYDFQEAALMLAEAGKRGVDVILVVGHKQPRWPECHHPAWYNSLTEQERADAQLRYVRNAVNYYKQFDAIKIWQVENEALFSFGPNCPQTPKELILKEMGIVRELDDRPVLLTDSGELGRWIPTARLKPDILGSTMYRVVHNPHTGYFKYPLPPAFFHVKAGIMEQFSGMESTDMIGVELQAEPWFADNMFLVDLETQYALMNPKIFQEYVQYAKDVGFKENYLWGAEWWYWLAHKHGDWGMWNEARQALVDK
jgi:hypothetical protein